MKKLFKILFSSRAMVFYTIIYFIVMMIAIAYIAWWLWEVTTFVP